MKHFKVCINYGRKCPAFETVVTAATEADAKHQAKVMASMCGFDAAIKKNNSAGVLNVLNKTSRNRGFYCLSFSYLYVGQGYI